ncbi:MAG: hypothetical protein AB9915_01590 [Candidatus Dojkabacteria bacterium]
MLTIKASIGSTEQDTPSLWDGNITFKSGKVISLSNGEQLGNVLSEYKRKKIILHLICKGNLLFDTYLQLNLGTDPEFNTPRRKNSTDEKSIEKILVGFQKGVSRYINEYLL